MPKTKVIYNVPCNVLLANDGTREKLIALSYYRGSKGEYAPGVREALEAGLDQILAGFSPSEKKIFDEILQSVKTQEGIRSALKADQSA